MEIDKLQWKAVKWGLISFIAVWLIWSVSSRLLVDSEGSPNIAVFYTVGVLSGLLPGYIASIVSGKYFVAHSLVTGIAVSLVLLLFWALIGALAQGSIVSLITTPILLITLSLVGGVIAKLQGKAL